MCTDSVCSANCENIVLDFETSLPRAHQRFWHANKTHRNNWDIKREKQSKGESGCGFKYNLLITVTLLFRVLALQQGACVQLVSCASLVKSARQRNALYLKAKRTDGHMQEQHGKVTPGCQVRYFTANSSCAGERFAAFPPMLFRS